MPVNHEFEAEYQDAKQAYKHCADKIREMKKSKKFYLGATSDPDGKFEEISTQTTMKNMYVLSQVPTQHKTENMYKKLLSVFGKQKHCVNEVQHDEDGKVTLGELDLAKKNNYVYIMFR